MIKNLGKFKQWTGERFGGAKVTLQTEDFHRLEQETENRREGYEHIIEAVEILQKYLLKRKTSPEDSKIKVMPFEALGSCLYHYGTIFPEDSALGIALINLGQAETRIAALQEALAQEIKEGYLKILENGLQDYKEYDSLRKKLASRRLDYDSKLNRLNKAKKEKPELEQEMQASRIKYEDTEHDLIQKMAYIQEFENEHKDALFELVQVQCTYHNQAKELFETVKSNWGQGFTSDSCDMMSKVMIRDKLNDSRQSIIPEETTHTTTSMYNQSPTSSTDDYHTSIESIAPNAVPARVPPPTNLPTRNCSIHEFETYRKALFDFTGSNNDEISFKTGDIISVIDAIDKGWWLGELNSKRGIFPVNYTEEYIPTITPSPPQPPPLLQHNTTDTSDSNNLRRPTYFSASPSSPTIPTVKSSLSRKRSAAIRAPPPPPSTARFNSIESTSTTSNNTHSILSDSSQPSLIVHEEPISYTTALETEIPPPPPPSRHNNVTNTNTNNNNTTTTSTTTTTINESHEPQTLENIDLPCHDCDCYDYLENPFKPGQCNNCFHKH